MSIVTCPQCWGSGCQPSAATLSGAMCARCRGMRWLPAWRLFPWERRQLDHANGIWS